MQGWQKKQYIAVLGCWRKACLPSLWSYISVKLDGRTWGLWQRCRSQAVTQFSFVWGIRDLPSAPVIILYQSVSLSLTARPVRAIAMSPLTEDIHILDDKDDAEQSPWCDIYSAKSFIFIINVLYRHDSVTLNVMDGACMGACLVQTYQRSIDVSFKMNKHFWNRLILTASLWVC